MRTITIIAFSLEELKTLAQADGYEKALEWTRGVYQNFEWWDVTLADWREKLKKRGFLVEDIFFSLAYSQGDGACFVGDVDVPAFIKYHYKEEKTNEILKLLREVEDTNYSARIIKSRHGGHYEHSSTVILESDEEKATETIANLHYHIITQAREYMDDIYRHLQEIDRKNNEEENLWDMAEVNEYEFDRAGRPVHHLVP